MLVLNTSWCIHFSENTLTLLCDYQSLICWSKVIILKFKKIHTFQDLRVDEVKVYRSSLDKEKTITIINIQKKQNTLSKIIKLYWFFQLFFFGRTYFCFFFPQDNKTMLIVLTCIFLSEHIFVFVLGELRVRRTSKGILSFFHKKIKGKFEHPN